MKHSYCSAATAMDSPGSASITADRPGGSAWPRMYSRAVALCLITVSAVQAATFSSVSFDPGRNELVATMVYDGTNPNHQFTVQWGKCRTLGDQGNHQIVAQLLDGQWDDAAQQTYTTVVHVSLASVNCQPALVTLRTAPNYEYTVQVP